MAAAAPVPVLRIPADVARPVFDHPKFQRLACAPRLRGVWVERPDGALFFQVHGGLSGDDAREFEEFARRVVEHLMPPSAARGARGFVAGALLTG
jgi:hypothetical protein